MPSFEPRLVEAPAAPALPLAAAKIHPLHPQWKKLSRGGRSRVGAGVAKNGTRAQADDGSAGSGGKKGSAGGDPLMGGAGDKNDDGDEYGADDPLSGGTVAVEDDNDPLGGGYIMAGDPLGGLGGSGSFEDGFEVIDDPLRSIGKREEAAAFVDTSAAAVIVDVPDVYGAPSRGPAAIGPWQAKRNTIIESCRAAEHVQIKCTFLNANKAMADEGYLAEQARAKPAARGRGAGGGEGASGGRASEKRASVDARTQQRLDELEDPDKQSNREFKMMSMRDFMDHLESLNAELKVAWRKQERVKSLRIAIQCARHMNDTSVAAFYPTLFVLVTDILDTFGQLVYERIRKRSADLSGKQLPDDFTCDDVHPEARETCRNWFFKVASIRELVPRLYVEMALVPCYRFLTKRDHPLILERLSKMIRGVAGPLVGVYLRAYLGRVGAVITSTFASIDVDVPSSGPPEYLISALFDFLKIYKKIDSKEAIMARLQEQQLEFDTYMQLQGPALEWITFCIGYKANQKTYRKLLKHYCDPEDGCPSALILHSIIFSFPADLIASTTTGLIKLIRETDTDSMAQHWLFVALGNSLNKAGSEIQSSLQGPKGLEILNEVWKVVAKYDSTLAYMHCAATWTLFVLKFRKIKELNIILADVAKHCAKSKDDSTEVADLLRRVALLVVESESVDFLAVLRSEPFQKVLDLFKGPAQTEVYKAVLRRFATLEEQVLADPVLLHTLLHVGRSLHDALDSLSFSDEQRQVADLAKTFISLIEFGTDFEQQLNFFLECRAAFTNLEAVRAHVVRGVIAVLMKTLTHVRGRHTKRTGAFAKACLAFAHITIPSLEGMRLRLDLYLECAQVALLNQFLPQTDTFIKTAISLIPEYKAAGVEGGDSDLVAYINAMLGWLVVMPGHPELGAFYLVDGLFNVVDKYEWEKAGQKLEVLTGMIGLMAAYAQKRLPYHVDRVISNDELFAGKAQREDLVPLFDKLVRAAYKTAVEVGEEGRKSQNSPQLRLLTRLLDALSLEGEGGSATMQMFGRLYKMSEEAATAPVDKVFLSNTRRHIALAPHLSKLDAALTKAGK